MKKVFIILLLFLMSSYTVLPVIHAEEVETEKVIVVYKDQINEKLFTSLEGEIGESYDNVPILVGEMPTNVIDVLENHKDVVAVEVDQVIQVNGQVQDWGIQKVNAPSAWNSNVTGKGVKIAIIDTGIANHEDLKVAGGVSITSYTNSYVDDNGHGTHVAGIIGAQNNQFGTIGVAPDANLYAVKVLDQNGSGYVSDIVAGIDWSISNKMDIINLSLGAPQDSVSLKRAVDKAHQNGVLVVAAGGNSGKADGSGDTVEYPARYDSVIAVSATDVNDKRGVFSATGATIEVAAPGVSILSTHLNNQFVRMNGTSMAAPYVAGILALYKEANPTLNHVQLREKLQQNTIDLGVEGRDSLFGIGLVNAASISKAQEEPKVAQEETNDTKDSEDAVSTEVVNQTNPTPVPKPIAQPIVQPVTQPVKTEPTKVSKPAPKKAVKKNAVSKVSTSKSTYKAGEKIKIATKVIDRQTKKPVKGATVSLTITPPKGKKQILTGKTNSRGEVVFYRNTTKRSIKGNYKLSITTKEKSYNNSYAQRTIKVR